MKYSNTNAQKRKAQKRYARTRRIRAKRVSFRQALQQFLTPQVFKEAHQAWQTPHQKKCSWCLKALMWVLMVMTFGKGDSLDERFLEARAFYVAEHPHEKRPGATCEGFQQALRRMPMAVLRALADGLRQEVGRRWIDELRIGGWLPIGCDGSRLECPRSEILEKRLGLSGKKDSAPMVYVTALVLLPLGLLWAWRLDKGTGSELQHLTQMLPTLPDKSLLVADAFYLGYDLYQAILKPEGKAAFLVRMSSRAHLYTESNVPLERFKEGWVHYWPKQTQEKHQPPLRLRLLRVGEGKVWLLTNLDKQTLSRHWAAKIYRWRWGNEGLFRTYKQTLKKMKLWHRTPTLVFREAEGSLLALQLMLAMAVQTMQQEGKKQVGARQVLLRIRGEITMGLAKLGPHQLRWHTEALEKVHGEGPHRKSKKTRRPWPRRKDHKPPKPPKFRRLTEAQKQLMARTLQTAKNKIL